MSGSTTDLDDLRDLAEASRFSALEETWMQRLAEVGESGPLELGPFLAATDVLLTKGETERLGVLLDLLLPLCEQADSSLTLEVLRRLMICAPGQLGHREAFISCYRTVHTGDPIAEVYLSLCGLETAPDPRKALVLLDRYLQLQPGSYVYHEAGWGTGKVESIDPVLRQVLVHLEGKPNHRIELQAVLDILELLPDDHFLALSLEGEEKLRELAGSEPVEMVGILITSFGNPLPLKNMKARLVPRIIASGDWSRWWTRTKNLLRKSGFFRVTDQAPYKVERLAESVSFEDELLIQFQKGEFSRQLAIARKYGRERAKKYERLQEHITRELAALIDRESGPRALEAAAVLERIGGDEAESKDSISGALRSAPDPVAAIVGVAGADEKRRVMKKLKSALEDSWEEVALALFVGGDDTLREDAAALILGAPVEERARDRVSESLRLPRKYPDLFSWSCRTHLTGGKSPFLEPFEGYPRRELLGRVLDVLDNLGMQAERHGRAQLRGSLGKAREILSYKKGQFFRNAVKPLPWEAARSFYQRVLSCSGLSEPLRVELLGILIEEFPDITRIKELKIWEEDSLYVTPEGVERKQDEFRDLTDNKLPANFKDIGRAAAFGDLSENAEYTSALEERDRLTKRATEMKEQLDNVKLITSTMLKDGVVTLGSRVQLVNLSTDQKVTYDILGPWDGGPADSVLNYRSPLGIVLLDQHVGEEVEAVLPGGKESFKILAVASALKPAPGPG